MAIPDVAALPCDRLISASGNEYMRRYYLSGGRSRFHHIISSDPGRDMHDHPWDFTSRLISGSYVEHTPSGTVRYAAPCVIVRKAEQMHRLELDDGDVWSYIVHGRARRKWGFQTDDGWLPWDRYAAGSIAGCGPSSRTPRRPLRRRVLPAY